MAKRELVDITKLKLGRGEHMSGGVRIHYADECSYDTACPVWMSSPINRNKAQLQELYRYLDGSNGGDRRLAWYGQCRAQEMSHKKALIDTIEHFSLDTQDWFVARGLPKITE
jgi:hypothetical protein